MATESIVIDFLKIWTKHIVAIDSVVAIWRDSEWHISLDCSDVFYYATADSEPVDNKKDLKILAKAIEDVVKITKERYGSVDSDIAWDVSCLYAARKRNRKPLPETFFYEPFLEVLFEDIKD